MFDPIVGTPNITIATQATTQGFVLDDTDGDMFDDLGNYIPNVPWGGGTIIQITFGQSPASLTITSGIIEYNYMMRRRSDGATMPIFTVDSAGAGTGFVGFPTSATNFFTGLPWVASDIMGSAVLYDFYFEVVLFHVFPQSWEFVLFDGSFMPIEFTPQTGSVISIRPRAGSVNGGQSVTIRGTSFTGAPGASVGGIALTSFVVVDDETITGITGEHAAGVVDVEVTGVGTLTGGYEYVLPVLILLPPLPVRTPIMQGGGKRGR